ncbi:ABC transporter permease [Spirochaeta isovalerica]|uniref:Transport permease protein n=1 Tax=Spirochaeta isovalerica TaxID=150 RepID=A0A841RAA6_9SPIO|nr:ABC transporter permease [Spirochaeta isovalerica]MBB6480301.1 lipooligosaccharide transport system permease protein [Spirochaeta isovalerica]
MSSSAIEKKALSGAAAHFGERRSSKAGMFGAWYAAEHRLLTMKAFVSTIVATSIFNPLMYLFALGVGIGSYVDKGSGGALFGVSYLTFVGPALLASASINAVFEETSYPVMGGFKWTREFYAMHAAPLRPDQIASGVLIAAMIRSVFTVLVFWIMLRLFGTLPSPRAILVLPAAVLSGLGIGSVMAALAASLKDDDGWFALINRMVIAPMFLFSGTFYPLEQMPIWIRWIGWISPLWHATDFGRWAGFDHPVESWLVVVHAVYLIGLAGIGWFLASRQFARRLEE